MPELKSRLLVNGTVFTNNLARADGGAIAAVNVTDLHSIQCMFHNNSAGQGGALCIKVRGLSLNSIVTKDKHDIHGTPPTYQCEKCDPMPPYGDVWSPKSDGQVQ